MERPKKYCKDSRAIKALHVMPEDLNMHQTIFGGKVMELIDDIAALSATRHARMPVVTASTDSVNFLAPVKMGDAICLESFVSWTSRKSMEVFVKVISEELLSAKRTVTTTAFLTFVALDEHGKSAMVPEVIPETELEIELYKTAPIRYEERKRRREETSFLVSKIDLSPPFQKGVWI
ncbi:acyl-CoA thioesterase [Fodinisporobacter ferrooxydans]|uniref:Acyl-CoA thioesterase n=1 Tax=Fodinisporobacter ferrooxydans TaxID=2901836 RepID=A0ABY4CM12_9BACL|nr:acyl-CoA thioesterase [Alicyclobacillaceae bacterium MYW30-H2]